jgi:hypothetical protein
MHPRTNRITAGGLSSAASQVPKDETPGATVFDVETHFAPQLLDQFLI